MRKSLCTRLLVSGAWLLSLLISPNNVNAQTGEWKVWVKTTPCSGRFDWITVAKDNPGGGMTYYTQANFIFPGTECTTLGCTFLEASRIADVLRPSSEFFKYCCRDYSVWENIQLRKRTVMPGTLGTPGDGWTFLKGNLCCEEAETLAGIPGACSGHTTQTQTNPVNCWPGSYPKYNKSKKIWECLCKSGLVWNATKTACVDPQELVNQTDCSGYPGSYAAWNKAAQRVECFCPKGKVWNATRTACIDPQDIVKQTDCSGYPGSYAAWNPTAQRVECFCPEGKVWNANRTACIDKTPEVNCYPGSYAAYNPQTQRTECFCKAGLVWNATKTACVDPKDLVAQTDCSGYPGSYPAWNAKAQQVECYCPNGKVWNNNRTACVDPPGNNNNNNNNQNNQGGPTWTLESVRTVPATPAPGWSFSEQGGTAHNDIYNGDKANYQWTPPPQQFNSNGFTMSLNAQCQPMPNSRMAIVIDVGTSGLTSNTPKNQSAYAKTPPDGNGSASNTLTFTTNSSYSEIEIWVVMNWGSVKCYYKYKRN